MTFLRLIGLRRALLCLVVTVAGCGRHQVDDGCLPACTAEDEALFEQCVAFGGGPDACRPGNRRCCALSAGCLGELGDQVVEANEMCGAPLLTVPTCRPPCSLFPDAELFFGRCVDGLQTELCRAGDTACCAEALHCLGDVGEAAVIHGPTGCCSEDEDCEGGQYCDVGFQCRAAACDDCGVPRSCADGVCACRSEDGTPVVRCPADEVCGSDGRCAPLDPCERVECDDDEVCIPLPDASGVLTEGACFVRCDGDPGACGSTGECDGFVCVERGIESCTPDRPCPDGSWCGPGGMCLACDPPGTPDGCEVGDNDCDGVENEDCPSCGNTVLEPPSEVCDGDDLGGMRCADLPEFNSGYLGCDATCAFDTEFCSTEMCGNGEDDDEDDLTDCDDPDCFSDVAADCCTPAPETCNGDDDDCDYAVDEGCAPPEHCFNGVDDDGDGDVDCDDSECDFPVSSACDGLDNDCNGVVDDEDPRLGDPCGTDTGICEAGRYVCLGGPDLVCDGEVGPELEVCDGVDNDCDGVIDDPVDACMGGSFCSRPGRCVGTECTYDSSRLTSCDDGNECVINECDEAADTCSDRFADASTMCLAEGNCDGAGMCDIAM